MLNINRSIPIWVPLLLGTILGALTALLWSFGIITMVKAMLPYAFASVLLILLLVAMIKAGFGNETVGFCHSTPCLRAYTTMLFILVAVLIPVTLAALAANPAVWVKTILAFIGGISYWILLLGFVSMMLSIRSER